MKLNDEGSLIIRIESNTKKTPKNTFDFYSIINWKLQYSKLKRWIRKIFLSRSASNEWLGNVRGFAPCLTLFSYSRGCVEFGRLTTVLFGELSAFTESRSVTRSLLLDAYTRGYEPNSARNDWFPLRHPDVSPILQLPSIPGFSRPCPRFCSRGIDLPTSQSENGRTDSHDRRSVSLRLPTPLLHITIPLCCTAGFLPPPYFSTSFYFHRCFISLLRLSCAVFAAVIEFYLRAESESIKQRPAIVP